jgi:hypothetical protein
MAGDDSKIDYGKIAENLGAVRVGKVFGNDAVEKTYGGIEIYNSRRNRRSADFPKTAYLKCEVGAGAFSSERILKFFDSQGRKVVGFFDANRIKDGKLKVDLFERDKDYAYIGIPKPAESVGDGARADERYKIRINDIILEDKLE